MKLPNMLFATGLLLGGAIGYFFADTYSNLSETALIGGLVCWLMYMTYDTRQLTENTSEMIDHLPEAKSLLQKAIQQGAITPPGLFRRSKIDFDKLD
jgi:hypothetical protein